MSLEYVKLGQSENFNGQNNLLKGQLEALKGIKNLKSYKLLRKEEFILKIALKSKIAETLESLKNLDKLLPKVKYEHEEYKSEKDLKKEKEKRGVEGEIRAIEEKLHRLQSGM